MKQYILALLSMLVFGIGSISGKTDIPSSCIDLNYYVHPYSYYSDTRNSNDFTDSFQGKPTKDIFYRIEVYESILLTVSHEGSDVSDTHIYLLDENGNRIAYQKNTPELRAHFDWPPSLKAELTMGTYYIVSEGDSENGNITTTIQGHLSRYNSYTYPPSYASIDAMIDPWGGLFTDTQEITAMTENRLCYRLDVHQPMKLEIRTENEEGPPASISLEDDARRPLGHAIEHMDGSSLRTSTLLPGVYYLLVFGEGIVTTHISGDSYMSCPPRHVGYQHTDFTYVDTDYSMYPEMISLGMARKDFLYEFEIGEQMDITISNCGSEATDTEIFLLNELSGCVAYSNNSGEQEACSNTGQASLTVEELPRGRYYVLTGGNGTFGSHITTSITGKASELIIADQGVLDCGTSLNWEAPCDINRTKYSFNLKQKAKVEFEMTNAINGESRQIWLESLINKVTGEACSIYADNSTGSEFSATFVLDAGEYALTLVRAPYTFYRCQVGCILAADCNDIPDDNGDDDGGGTIEPGMPVATITYNYNIRSWVTGIYGSYFNQHLFYNESNGSNQPAYNGNISATSWNKGEPHDRAYNFYYDQLSRLTSANYSGLGKEDYTTAYSYDKHGNMLTLTRQGRRSGSADDYGAVDQLAFTYTGNQLKTVTDDVTGVIYGQSADFKGNATGDVHYSFNRNGAMVQDLNKGITNIQYNSLNLPQEMVINSPTARAKNYYTYSASGVKLRVEQRYDPNLQENPVVGTSPENDGLSDSKVTDYVGNKVYVSGELTKILVDGGYYDVKDKKYYFYIQDHLGNNRVVVSQTGKVVQRNDYYPFGMEFADNTNQEKQDYKYNGKELDKMHGLNWYDYSARQTVPDIGNRFTTIDPLAEKYYSWSPYNFGYNNPIRFIDPTGEGPGDIIKGFVYGIVQGVKNTTEAIITSPVTLSKSIASHIEGNSQLATVNPEVGQFNPENFVWENADNAINAVNSMVPAANAVSTAATELRSGGDGSKTGEAFGELIGGAMVEVATLGAGKMLSTLGKGGNAAGKTGNLGNPYKNKTLNQVRESMDKQVKKGKLEVKVKDPVTGKNKTYQNKKSKYSYNLDAGDTPRKGGQEKPHIDVNYPKPKPKNIRKKKLDVKGM